MPKRETTTPILVEIVRSGIVEARLRGSMIALKDARIYNQYGPIQEPFFFRSVQKPFQALVLLDSGAFEEFNLDQRHLALATGSLDGTPEQVKLVLEMLEKAGLAPQALACPASLPFHTQERERQSALNQQPMSYFHMCAGKHAAMILASLAYGESSESYLLETSRVQKTISRFMHMILEAPHGPGGLKPTEHALGYDGCGTPVLAANLQQIVASFARLAFTDDRLSPHLAALLERTAQAMATFPELVGGNEKRLDSEIMRASQGSLIAKSGAEGLFVVARRSDGLALGIKMESGSKRGLGFATLKWLLMLGMLQEENLTPALQTLRASSANENDQRVGHLRYCGPHFDAPSPHDGTNAFGFHDAR